MSRPKLKSRESLSAAETKQHRHSSISDVPALSKISYFIVFIIGVGMTTASFATFGRFKLSSPPTTQTTQRKLPSSYYDLLALSPTELGHVDIALMNLLCAQGLPGAENLDIAAVQAKLDEWAKKVRFETDRHLYRLNDPRFADHYKHSEARLRAEFIVQCLQEDCGVRYNPERIYSPDTSDSRDTFIHGMLPGANGGTCASMPVMYVAIGRRLGYPMKLVSAKAHLFCRWDDGKEASI